MREIGDIQAKLRANAYQNEEHVRFALVGRILELLGWDIWDPAQVNAEFVPNPAEEKTKVDIALFRCAGAPDPVAFIEVKAVGKIANSLPEIERQLRDYNKNNTALFSIITDGRTWADLKGCPWTFH